MAFRENGLLKPLSGVEEISAQQGAGGKPFQRRWREQSPLVLPFYAFRFSLLRSRCCLMTSWTELQLEKGGSHRESCSEDSLPAAAEHRSHVPKALPGPLRSIFTFSFNQLWEADQTGSMF